LSTLYKYQASLTVIGTATTSTTPLVVDTVNTSFADINDTIKACIISVTDTNEKQLESLKIC
jgi:hypothetical protein